MVTNDETLMRICEYIRVVLQKELTQEEYAVMKAFMNGDSFSLDGYTLALGDTEHEKERHNAN